MADDNTAPPTSAAQLSSSDEKSPILHVMLVDFHHSNGPQVEFAVPSLPKDPVRDSALVLPSCWNSLPFLALPDGLHRFAKDSTFFVLPDPDDDKAFVYGTSCAMQIAARSLKHTDIHVTRNTVLKAICVVARLPFFQLVLDHINATTAVLFEQRDFSKKDLLEDLHNSLTRSLTMRPEMWSEYLYAGLNAREFVLHHRQQALVLFKLILLRKKILVTSSDNSHSAQDICTTVLTLASLCPGLMHTFLPKQEPAPDATDHAPQGLDARTQRAHLPFKGLDTAYHIHPYVPLQKTDQLLTEPFFIGGSTNSLLTRTPEFADVILRLGKRPELKLVAPGLTQVAQLTTQDVRFVDAIVAKCQAASKDKSEEVMSWAGSAAWVRQMFADYVIHLLATADLARTNPDQQTLKLLHEFNWSWFCEFKKQRAYACWCAIEDQRIGRPSRRASISSSRAASRSGSVGSSPTRSPVQNKPQPLGGVTSTSSSSADGADGDIPRSASLSVRKPPKPLHYFHELEEPHHPATGSFGFGDVARRARYLTETQLGPGYVSDQGDKFKKTLKTGGQAMSSALNDGQRRVASAFSAFKSSMSRWLSEDSTASSKGHQKSAAASSPGRRARSGSAKATSDAAQRPSTTSSSSPTQHEVGRESSREQQPASRSEATRTTAGFDHNSLDDEETIFSID